MNELMLSIVFSSIGIGYIAYGKKHNSVYYMLSGAGLLLYTYFVSGLWTVIIVGCLLCALPYFLEKYLPLF